MGQRVGLRLTLTKRNYLDLDRIFDFIEQEGINRACFYHLVYSGRAENSSPTTSRTRNPGTPVSIIIDRTEDYFRRGLDINILTVDNHCDGVYLYLKLKERDPARAAEVYKLLAWNGGGAYSTGVGIGEHRFLRQRAPGPVLAGLLLRQRARKKLRRHLA